MDERFTMPTDEQLIEIAIIINDGRLNAFEISNMVAMSTLILDRLYENGSIEVPSKKEIA